MNVKIKRIVKILVPLLLVGGCAYGGWNYYQAQQAANQTKAIETAEVTRMNLKSTVSATGTIRPVNSVEVSSKITARIKSVLVKENDTVKSGQTVATLDGKDYEAKLEQAQYKVTNTRAKYNRIAYLYSIGANTQADYEDAEYNYQTAQSSLSETQSDLAETVITAPMDGVVVGEPQTAGTMAVQGTSNPTVIMRIADLSQKQIMAKVDETDIGNIRVGQNATFTVDAHTGKTFTAKVSKISQTDVSNTWDTTSSTSSSSTSSSSSASVIYYYVTLDVDDPDNLLLPAMTARVEINTSEKPNALAVPISALKTNTDGSYVLLVLPDGKTEERTVSIGIYSDEYVEITDGLEEGDKVSITYKAATSSTSGSKSSSSSKSSGSHSGPPPM
jgi:HlyD family secretion protein/macrolide-specific efflux system membrane fusion protein